MNNGGYNIFNSKELAKTKLKSTIVIKGSTNPWGQNHKAASSFLILLVWLL